MLCFDRAESDLTEWGQEFKLGSLLYNSEPPMVRTYIDTIIHDIVHDIVHT